MIKNTACRPMIHQPTPNTQSMNTAQRQQHQPRAQRQTRGLEAYLIVICFAIWPPLPPTPPSLDAAALDPGFLSKIFQNLRLSSAATMRSLAKQHCTTLDHSSYLQLPAFDHRDSSNCEELG